VKPDVIPDPIEEIQQALKVLERLGRTKELRGEARTALRIRTMALVDRLEVELGKRRLLEGNFAAARYHLGAARERPFKLKMALLALRLAPRLLRRACLRFRPALWKATLSVTR
jgi:hypothetical protein